MNNLKTIPGFSNYMVDKEGNVYSKSYNKTGVMKIMKQRKNRYGYMQIQLTRDDSKQKLMSVHRLVAITFIPKIKGKDCINHKNGIKNDNRVENLEWCTQSENTKHSFYITKTQSIKRVKQQAKKNIENRRKNPKLTVEQINEIEEKYNNQKISHRELAKIYNCGKTLIGTVLRVRKEERKTIESIIDYYKLEKSIYDINGRPMQLSYILSCFNCKIDGKGQIYFVNKFVKCDTTTK